MYSANLKWVPDEKDILSMLNKNKVKNPCFNSLKLKVLSLSRWIALEIMYREKEATSSPIMTRNMILQLLEKLVENPISLNYYGVCCVSGNICVLKPLNILNLARGSRYNTKKSYEINE